MGTIRLFRIIIKKAFQACLDKIIKLLPIYYTSIDRMPIAYWFELQNNKFEVLYKIRLFKRIPNFFYQIANDMYFQFDNLDMTLLRKKADMIVLSSIAARTNNASIKFQSEVLKREIEKKVGKSGNEMKLNDFIDYIELTFESIGMVKPYETSTSRVFSLYHKAVANPTVSSIIACFIASLPSSVRCLSISASLFFSFASQSSLP